MKGLNLCRYRQVDNWRRALLSYHSEVSILFCKTTANNSKSSSHRKHPNQEHWVPFRVSLEKCINVKHGDHENKG